MKANPNTSSVEDIKNLKRSAGNIKNKKILFILFSIILLTGLFIWSRYEDNKRIEVARIKTEAVVAGDAVTLDVLQPVKITKEEYERDGVIEVTAQDGSKSIEQTIILWRDIDKYVGNYFSYFMQKNTNFTTKSSSEEMQFKNPLLETMPLGNELYSLPIDPSGININQLLPSTTIRVRVAQQVPIGLVSEIETALAEKSVYDGSSVIRSVLLKHGVATTAGGSTSVLDGGDYSTSVLTEENKDLMTTMVTVSEVIFDELVAVDMCNSAKESIYEIYMSLMTMPLEERVPYMRTQFTNDVSGEFRSRVTPATLELDLTKEEASNMHIYENEGYSVKYTIIKKDTTNNTLKEFMEINNQLLTQMQAAQGGS